MFDDLLKGIEQLGQKTHTFSVPLQADEDGYLDRECPSENCTFQFKIWNDDFEGDEQTIFYCPLCRHEAHIEYWHTQKQIEEGEKQAEAYMISLVDQAFHEEFKKSAQKFNRSQKKNQFISMQMKVGKAPARFIPVPIAAKQSFQQKIECENCQTKFAVIGAAFFCPKCGTNSADRTLEDALKKVRAKTQHIDSIKEAISDPDEAEIVARSMLESCLSDCVVAFQRFCEITYSKHPKARENIPFNCFQRLNQGSELWRELFGEGYEDWLSEEEYNKFKIFFQRRHLLLHCEGIVDDKYIQKSEDNLYKERQRIIVNVNEIIDLCQLVATLTLKIRENHKK